MTSSKQLHQCHLHLPGQHKGIPIGQYCLRSAGRAQEKEQLHTAKSETEKQVQGKENMAKQLRAAQAKAEQLCQQLLNKT